MTWQQSVYSVFHESHVFLLLSVGFLKVLQMTHFSYPDGIAVWRLIYYIFALIGSVCISWRHGFGKNSGWIYLAIFSIIRIINSSAELATLSSSNSSAATVAAITGFLGLSPLLLAALGLVSRLLVAKAF
jgi:hypothetical protein